MSDVDDTTRERVTTLEVKLAYQDKLLAELDAVVREFADRVIALEARIGELTERHAAAPITDEPPPHY